MSTAKSDTGSAAHFSERGLWAKLAAVGTLAGSEIIERALQLFYASQDRHTPAWARGVIYGALGYFVLPADAIPDIVPITGYADDLGVFAMACATVAMYITPQIRERARQKLRDWFG